MYVKYRRLAEQLRDLIRVSIKSGIPKLPTEMELCSQFHVSRQTVRQSLALLCEEGLISRRQGSGYYLTGRLPGAESSTIGLLLSNSQEYLYPALMDDIKSRLFAAGFSLQLYPTDSRFDKEREALKQILKNPLRGLIIEGCKSALPNPNLDLYKALLEKELPLLFLSNYYDGLPEVSYIKDNNAYGSYLLISRLADAGHTQIAGIFQSDEKQGLERFQGFAACLRDNGCPLLDHHLLWYDSETLKQLQKNQDTAFLSAFLEKNMTDCTAVVCHNDEIAYWLIRELQYRGMEIPRDMTVACFEHSYLSELGGGPGISLSHKPHEIGNAAADAMLEMCRGLPISRAEIPWQLYER